jgi:hypothetical protein
MKKTKRDLEVRKLGYLKIYRVDIWADVHKDYENHQVFLMGMEWCKNFIVSSSLFSPSLTNTVLVRCFLAVTKYMR